MKSRRSKQSARAAGKNVKVRSRRVRSGPKNAEQYFSRSERFQSIWNRVTHAITKMRNDRVSLAKAAREFKTSPNTVKRLAKSALRKNKRGRFVAHKADRLLRVLQIPTSEGLKEIATSNSSDASKLAEYWDALQKYLETGDTSGLKKFRGQQIIDATGTKHSLLTDLNELNRLGAAGILSFESLYAKSA